MASVTITSSWPAADKASRIEETCNDSSAEAQKLGLVIPALREAENLPELLKRVRAALDRVQIPSEALVVDDDSRDGTREIVSSIGREDPRVRLLVRTGERGMAGAVLHGWQHTDATILGVMDADGQHPPELMPVLVASILAGYDLAIASRYAEGASGACDSVRRLISAVSLWAARPLHVGRLQVSDPLSGFFLVRRRCIDGLAVQETGFKLLLEILVRGRIGEIKEAPFVFGRRRAGRSKLNLKVAWDYLALLARLYAARLGIARVPQASSGD